MSECHNHEVITPCYSGVSLADAIIISLKKLTKKEYVQNVKEIQSCDIFDLSVNFKECGRSLYVGLARAVPPTNTNLQLTSLLIRLQGALYEDLTV